MRAFHGLIFFFLLGCTTARELPVEFSESDQAIIPHSHEVCFSPDEQCDKRILTFIGKAKKSIDIAAYELTLKPLVEKLGSLAKKISIRIVVNEKGVKPGSLLSSLREAGAQVRAGDQRGLMHDKFTIIDGAMVETGSFNYSQAAVERNQENQVYLTAPDVVARFKERFQKMWEEGIRAP